MTKDNQRLIVASLVSLMVGVVIGVFVNAVFPGTAGDDDSNTNTNATEESMLYYEISLEDATTWLATTYPSIEGDVVLTAENLLALNQDPLADPRKIAEADLDVDTTAMVDWTQAALDGVSDENIVGRDGIASDELELSKDPLITACLGVNDDPFATTAAAEESGITLYLEVPVGEDKNVPKDWEAIDQKSPTDLYWIAVKCSPEPEAAAN